MSNETPNPKCIRVFRLERHFDFSKTVPMIEVTELNRNLPASKLVERSKFRIYKTKGNLEFIIIDPFSVPNMHCTHKVSLIWLIGQVEKILILAVLYLNLQRYDCSYSNDLLHWL